MKKFLFYISTIREGGAARVLVNLANSFSNAGYEVVLVTNFMGEHEYPVKNTIKRYILEKTESKESVFKKNLFRCRELRKIIKKEKSDICVSFLRENNFRLILASFFLKTKKFVSIRSAPEEEYPGRTNRLLLKLLFPWVNGCIMQTDEAQNWLPNYIKKKSHVIMNMIDDKFFCVNRTELPKGIVTVGRLTKSKNHKLLIQAYAEIADLIGDDLYIYGEGECKELLYKYAKVMGVTSRVHFEGYTTDVEKIYKQAKLFVLTSDFEGMPNALLEALASGVPCISTDCPCGGPRDILEYPDGNIGLLVPVGDRDALKNAILLILRSPDYAKELSSRALMKSVRWSETEIFKLWESYLVGN